MHLGCNLRKAFLDGVRSGQSNDVGNAREYYAVDTFVHEFCKMFGRKGTPEYGSGVLNFPDFLSLMHSNKSSMVEPAYYEACSNVILERQVGNRYFVTAANAGKVFFLKDAAKHFIEYTGKSNGNRLEKEVYRKLQDVDELALLKADALMFYHVYADLVMLAKSSILGKSVVDMSTHYLELQLFLKELSSHPEVAMDRYYHVFKSESRLYSDNIKTNHRLHSKSALLHHNLFQRDNLDDKILEVIAKGATMMEQKLQNYAANQLPGGKYWSPTPKVKAVLSEISPSNDICESILGLNDYLSTAIPNTHQQTRSNLTQIKKNRTITWLEELPQQQQDTVVQLAYSQNAAKRKERIEDKHKRQLLRQEKMIQEHKKKELHKAKTSKELSELSKISLITSSQELYKEVRTIDDQNSSITAKTTAKLKLVRNQISIRKKILLQNISIPFTQCKTKRPIKHIIKDLENFILLQEQTDPSIHTSWKTNKT